MAEMTVYDELVARGLIAQVTDEELIKNLINNGKATFYIGFDPTADSLHVGHFMALCFMKRLQMAGNKPIALVGGGTGMIGDPSGKTDMRKMLTPEQIEHNCECFKKNSYGEVFSGSSHTAPLTVLPIFLPSELRRSVIVIAEASLPSFLLISSVPPSILLHWSSPPN